MKTSTSLRVVVLFAAAIIIMAAQWRSISRLQHENRDLQGVQEQAEQTRAELEQATQALAHVESEAQVLRTKVATLQSEVQMARQEVEQFESAAKQGTARVQNYADRLAGGDAVEPPAIASGGRLSQERRIFHMHPTTRANLTPLPQNVAWAFKTGGPLDDVEVYNGITRDAVAAGPDWKPTQPLPLSFPEAEEIARRELRAIVRDAASWELSDIRLHRMQGGSSKWSYSMCFHSNDKTFDTFTVHVSMAGTTGKTGLDPGD